MNQRLLLVVILSLIVLLWHYPVFVPLKILVVFFHESSHALMTVMTGGEVRELVVSPMQGGHVISAGGNRFLTLSAGYLGSLMIGVLIYLAASLSRFDKILMGCLGVFIIGIAITFTRDMFALVFSIVTGIAMLSLAKWMSMGVNDAVLKVIGLTSMLYVPIDIYSDTIERFELKSDAFMLAEEFVGTGVVWGGLWLILSLIAIAVSLFISLKVHPDLPAKTD